MSLYDSDYVPRSAIAIFAHPDDAEFTVAGTLAGWARAGCEATLVLITSGNAGTHDAKYQRETLAPEREEEQRKAARILGITNLVFLGRDDCTVVPTIDLRRELVREIRRFKPEVLVCGDPQMWFYGDRYINHPDHRAAAEAALDAAFPCAEMELLWPELGAAHRMSAVYVSSTREPNTWIDIGETMDAKIASLKAHASQMGGWDPSELVRTWAEDEAKRARSESGPNLRYAESFRVMKLHDEEKPES